MKNTSCTLAQVAFIPPVTVSLLAGLGMVTVEQLRTAGAVHTYLNLKRVQDRVSLTMLWALEAAATGQMPAQVCGMRRAQLLSAFADAQYKPRLPIHRPHFQGRNVEAVKQFPSTPAAHPLTSKRLHAGARHE